MNGDSDGDFVIICSGRGKDAELMMDRGLVLYKMNLKICFIKLNSLVVDMLRMLGNISYGR